MTEEVGLIVRAKMVPDRRGMERIAKETAQATKKATANVERSIKGIMPKSLGGMFSGGMKGLGGGGLKGAAVAGGVGGMVAGAVMQIPALLKKSFGVLVQSSGQLRGVMKLLERGFLQILRPFADTLALMLRPVALFFRAIGREIMKRVRERRKELKAQGLSGMGLGLALMEDVPGIYLDVLIEYMGKIDWAGLFVKFGEFFWTMLTQKFPEFLSKLGTTGELILLAIIAAIGTMAVLGTLGALVLAAITLGIGPMTLLGGLGAGILSTAMSAIGTMGVLAGLGGLIFAIAETAIWASSPEAQKLYDQLTGGRDQPADQPPLPQLPGGKVGYIDVMKPGANSETLYDNLKKPFEDIYNWMGGSGPLIPGLATGGEVLTTGLVNMHRGEVAQNKGELLRDIRFAAAEAVNGGGQPIQVNVVIPGAVMRAAMIEGTDKYYRERVVSRR